MKMDESRKEKDTGDMRRRILDTAFEMIKQYGLTHTSVEKITKAVSIGKGSFYAYFPSKEEMVYELMKSLAAASYADFLRRLAGRERMTEEEGKEYFFFIVKGPYSIYRYLTPKDMEHLEKALDFKKYDEISVAPDASVEAVRTMLSRMEHVRKDVDLRLVSALYYTLRVAFSNWPKASNTPSLEETRSRLYEHLFSLIFEDKNRKTENFG